MVLKGQIKSIIITGIKNKLNRGEELDDILESYVNLSEDNKTEIRGIFNK